MEPVRPQQARKALGSPCRGPKPDCGRVLSGSRVAETGERYIVYFLIVGGLYSVTALRKTTMRYIVY